jgi:hypothetical protein
MSRIFTLGFAIIAAAGVSGCVVSQPRISNDFGVAVRQDVVAQIADPDPRYPGPPPPSSGSRAALAQFRYRTGQVIPPVATASDIGVEAAAGAPPAPAPSAQSPGP